MVAQDPRPGISPAAVIFEGDVPLTGIMVGTPMYGGLCHGAYTAGMIDLAQECMRRQIPLGQVWITNESLIQRARNQVVGRFLASSCSHLVFIDGDIGFTGLGVLRLIAHGRPIMAGTYRKKTHREESYVFNLHQPGGYPAFDDRTGALRVKHAGTGCLAIRRDVLEAMWAEWPELRYRLAEGEPCDGGDWCDRLFAAFECRVDPDTRTYVSEDYLFCERAAELGFETWMDPGVVLEHHGMSCFSGDLAAQLAQAETA